MRFAHFKYRYTISAFKDLMVFALLYPFRFLFTKKVRRQANLIQKIIRNPFFEREIELGCLLSESLVVSVGPARANPHNVSEYELFCISAIVKNFNCAQVFEIGTYDGRSSRSMALNLPDDGRVCTLNLPPVTEIDEENRGKVDVLLSVLVESGCRFKGTPEQNKITELFGDSATFDFADYHDRFDLVFIDGSHEYEYVKNDTTVARALIKQEGGIIIWHDAQLYGVVRYLSELINDQGWPIEIIRNSSLAVVKLENNVPQSLSEITKSATEPPSFEKRFS